MLQNCYFDNISFSFVSFVLDLIISIITIVNGISLSKRHGIYPNTSFAYILTPKLLSKETWTILSSALTAFYIVTFIICYRHKKLCISLHWILNPCINIVLLPFFSHTFAYSISNPTELNEFIFIILFVCYLLIFSFLYFVYTNSIIHPSSFYHEWFSGSNILYPLYIAFTNIAFLISSNLSKYNSIILMAISALISLIYAIYIIQKMPFFLLFTNDIIISKMLCFCLYSVLIIIKINFKVHLDTLITVSIPLVYILLVFLVKIIADKKRSSIHKILSQIDSSFKQYSVDALATALPSIVKSESAVQWAIKEGIILGNQSVINKEFLHLCIKKFRKSQWFISLISFLIGVNWEGERSSAYRILLHVLSLQDSVFTSLQLFQVVYIMNQNSDVELSQIISRDISRYRFSLHYFAKMHQNFWSSALNDNEKEFRASLRNLYLAKVEQKKLIHSLLRMYEFSPSVQLHASLYYSDIEQNYIKSGKHYRRAVLMRTNREEYVSTEMLSQFSSLLPKSSKSLFLKNEKNFASSDDISFLSVRTSHNTALRCQPAVSLNDDFLEALCQTYSIPMNTAKQKILPFADKTTSIYKITFFCLTIIYIFLALFVQVKYYEFRREINLFSGRLDLITSTIEFRWHLSATSLDIRLLVNIINETYQPFTNSSIDFYYFIVDHLSSLTQSLVKYENQINEIHILTDNSFTNEFGELHNYCKYFITTRDISNLMKTVSDSTLNKLVNRLEDLSEFLYLNFTIIEQQKEEEVKKVFTRIFIILILGIIIVYVFSIIFFFAITNSIENLLFLILKTVQAVVISEIQEKFNKLFNYDHPKRLKRNEATVLSTYGIFILSLIMMALSTIIYPLFKLVLILSAKPSAFRSLPEFLNITSETESIYYALAVNEFGINHHQSNCIHSYTEINLDGYTQPSIVITNKIDVQMMNVLFIIFAIFLVVFIIEFRSSIMMYKFVQVVLKFIPQHAADSSPVLAPLWRGQSLKKSDVIHFKQMIISFKEIENSGFFCLLFFNDSGEVIRTIGNVVNILHCQPKTLWQLVTYIKENSKEPSVLIDEFFNNNSFKNKRTNHSNNNNQVFSINTNNTICNVNQNTSQSEFQTASISLEAFHEISLTFSDNGHVLTIKDDGHHFLRNQQLRAIMNAKVPSIQQEAPSEKANCSQNDSKQQQAHPFIFQFPQSQQNQQQQKIIYDNCIIILCEINLSNIKITDTEGSNGMLILPNLPIFDSSFSKTNHSHPDSSDLEDTTNGEECINDIEMPNANINGNVDNNKSEIDFKTVLKREDSYVMICDASFAAKLLDLIKKLKVKTVVHINGQICVFKSKFISMPQVFGQAFDEAKAMMKIADNADVIVSKNYWLLTNENKIDYEMFNIGFDMAIEIHRFPRNHASEYFP